MSEINNEIKSPHKSIIDFSIYDGKNFEFVMDLAFIMNIKINQTVEKIKNISDYSQITYLEWEAIKIILKEKYYNVQDLDAKELAFDLEAMGVLKYEFGNFERKEVALIVSFISKQINEEQLDKSFNYSQKMKLRS
jgi:hypothetical protein